MKYRFRRNRLKEIVVILMGLFLTINLHAQSENPVEWEISYTTEDGKATIEFKANIEENWHLYALKLPSDEGPIPTEIVFNPSDDYALMGETQEGTPLSTYDSNFDMDILYFEHETVFVQTVELKADKPVVSGYITFMVCDDERCLPPVDYEFKITIE